MGEALADPHRSVRCAIKHGLRLAKVSYGGHITELRVIGHTLQEQMALEALRTPPKKI